MSALDGSIVHHRAAGDLPRHPPRPARPGQRRLPAVDDHGVPAGPGGARGHARPARRHVRPGPASTTPASRSSPSPRSCCPSTRSTAARGALWLIGWRVVQAVGGSMLTANSAAILTDAFPRRAARLRARHQPDRRAWPGSSSAWSPAACWPRSDWRAVFWVNVPVGVFGTIWAYRSLRDTGERRRGRIDWWGNVTFAVGLSAVLDRRSPYGIQPYGGHAMGWTNPLVLAAARRRRRCCWSRSSSIESRVAEPMFELALFRIRAFTAGNVAGLLVVGRPRRAAVHADHLAAGHLAAAARLRLRATPRCGPASSCCR